MGLKFKDTVYTIHIKQTDNNNAEIIPRKWNSTVMESYNKFSSFESNDHGIKGVNTLYCLEAYRLFVKRVKGTPERDALGGLWEKELPN